jgi:hypothetical protein
MFDQKIARMSFRSELGVVTNYRKIVSLPPRVTDYPRYMIFTSLLHHPLVLISYKAHRYIEEYKEERKKEEKKGEG